MYLLFLTYKVKYSAVALNIVNWQNAYSITLAVRSIVKLFRLVKHENELYQEILVFLILYNYQTIRIYGHYFVINKKKTTFYRHPIKEFSFTSKEGKNK
jgi:hypothetical protein